MTDHPESSTDANRVEKSPSKNDPPVVSSGSLTDFGVSPTKQTVSPSNSDCDALLTDQAVSPAHCSASPAGKTESLTNCGASPTGKAVSITDYCGESCTDQTVSPTRCGVSPTDQTGSPADCGVPHTVQVESHSGGNVSDSLVSASTTGGENASNSTSEINSNNSFLSKEFRNLSLKPNFTEKALNVETVRRRTLLPENEQYLTYLAREQTIPTSSPNRALILKSGFYLEGACFECYSCGIRYSMSDTPLQFWENHTDNCLHHQVKSKSPSQNEDVFVNRNAADTEACYKCKIKIKKVLFLECRHLMTCTDCLLEDLHRGPSEPRTPGSDETSGQDGNIGLHEESIACPLCGKLSSTYVIIQWD